MYKQITPVVLTLNEEENIGRCLDQLTWATTVLVLDSGSIDNTESICSKYKNVNFVPHNFEDHAKQWTAAIDHASVKTDWVLTLDAHYILDRKFKQELERLNPEVGVNAFEADFVYLINGQPLNCSLYPPRVILARRNSLSFILDGYTQRQKIVGRVEKLNSKINHDDRKSDSQWRDSQAKYAKREAKKIIESGAPELSWSSLVRKHLSFSPYLVCVYLGLVKGLWFFGPGGKLYIQQRVYFERLLQENLRISRRENAN